MLDSRKLFERWWFPPPVVRPVGMPYTGGGGGTSTGGREVTVMFRVLPLPWWDRVACSEAKENSASAPGLLRPSSHVGKWPLDGERWSPMFALGTSRDAVVGVGEGEDDVDELSMVSTCAAAGLLRWRRGWPVPWLDDRCSGANGTNTVCRSARVQ